MHDGFGREASLTHLGYDLVGYRFIPIAEITVAIPAWVTDPFWDVHPATPRSIQCRRSGQVLTVPGSLYCRFDTYSSSSQFFVM